MIPVPANPALSGAVRVWLATGHTDMRNYAERMIMQSPRMTDPRPVLLSTI